ncbi:MAG: hypothetical protein ABIK09_12445 [Pseudomonadota bacterium]
MSTRVRRGVVILSILLMVISLGELGLRLYGSFFSIGGSEDPDAFHLYVIGGSTAEGVPYAPLSFGILVSAMFEGTLDGRPIVVHDLAVSGDTIYTQWVRFERAVRARDGDVPGAVLIYSGHNDGAGDLGDDPASLGTRLERSLCRSSALGLETSYWTRRLLRRSAADALDSYGTYLREVVDTAHGAGLTPFLSSVVSNLSDIEPSYETDDREGVRRALAEVAPLEEAGDCAAAGSALAGALPEGRGKDAFGAYRLGRCLRRAGRHGPAMDAYWVAVDLDPRDVFGRATRLHNEIISRVGEEHGAQVVDAVGHFAQASPHGLIGDELFSDGQHPNLRGHLLLAVGFAEALSARFDEPIRRRFEDAAEVHAAFPPEDPAFPFLHGGSWLLAVSFRHPWPMDRLRAAEARFRSALALEPRSFTGWMGLGLARAGQSKPALLQSPEVIAQIDRWGGFTYHGFNVPLEELEALLELLRSAGVEDDILEGVAENHPERRDREP